MNAFRLAIGGWPGALVVALALVTAGCGDTRTTVVTDRVNETYIEYMDEEKSRSVPAVRHVLNHTTGELSLTFFREIEGPIYRAEKFTEVRKTMSETDPDLVATLLWNTILFGMPLLLLPFNDEVQEMHFGSSEELYTTTRVIIDKNNAVDTGRTDTMTLSYPGAPFLLRFGEGLIEGHADEKGEATVNLFEIIAGTVYPKRASGENIVIEIATKNENMERIPIRLKVAGRSVLTQFARDEAERRVRLQSLRYFAWGGDKSGLLFLGSAVQLGYSQSNLYKHEFHTTLPPLPETASGKPEAISSKVRVVLESESHAFELVEELATRAVKIAALQYAGAKPQAPTSIVQDKYESRAMFEARVDKIRTDYGLALREYAKRFQNFPQLWRNKIIEDSFYYVFQNPKISKTYYDPESQFFAMDVISTSPHASEFKYRLALDTQTPNDEAREFDKLLKRADPLIRFSFDNGRVSFGSATIRVGSRDYTAFATGDDFATRRLAELDLSGAIKDAEVVATTPSIAVYYVESPEILRKQKELERMRREQAAESELSRLEAEIARLRSNSIQPFDDDLPALIEALPPSPADHSAYLFAIGVNDYDEGPDVPFADRSAKLFVQLMQRQFGILEINTFVLVGDKATGTRIKDRLALLMNRLQLGDKVYLYYAGHGVPARDGKSLYMLPRDGTIRTYEDPAFNFDNLLAKLSASPAAHIFAFADTCFSGRASEDQLVFDGIGGIIVTAKEPGYNASKVTVFLAGRKDQFANQYEQRGHRLFTYHLIRGLAEGRVEPVILHSYVAKRVEEYSRRLGITYTQQPLLEGNKDKRLKN